MPHLSVGWLTIVETGGLFAPLLFIGFHLLRPLFFLPVIFICVSGGFLFGTLAGSLYSLIGITLSSIIFYRTVQWMPKTMARLLKMKQRMVGKHVHLTTSQVAVLRLIPFVHFHLLSLCLLEVSDNFKEYMRSSLYSNIPLAVVYTSAGKWVSSFSPLMAAGLLLVLLAIIYLLRKKEIIMKWEEFFRTT